MELEQQIFAEVTIVRLQAMLKSCSLKQKLNIKNKITQAMDNIVTLINNYLKLKSDLSFIS